MKSSRATVEEMRREIAARGMQRTAAILPDRKVARFYRQFVPNSAKKQQPFARQLVLIEAGRG
jgi:hypothetical protein